MELLVDTSEIVAFIRKVPIFRALSKDQLEQVAVAADVRTCAAGELLAEPGGQANELFIVVEGEFRVYLREKDATFEKDVARLGPGDYFGVIPVVTGRHAGVAIEPMRPGRVIALSAQTIDDLFEGSPGFAKAMWRSLGSHVAQSIDRIGVTFFAELDSFPDLSSTCRLLPPHVSHVCQSLVVEHDGNRVTVAMVNPGDLQARAFIVGVLRQFHVEFVVVAEDDFRRHALRLLGADVGVSGPDVPFESLMHVNSTGAANRIDETDDGDFLPGLLTAAIRAGASDVHIEPHDAGGKIRLRVDGRMFPIRAIISPHHFHRLVSRIKVMSELDITSTRRPQDGRFLVRADDQRIEFRVSATPCFGGENVVLRVVDPNPDFLDLGNLILSEPVAAFANELFQSPSGLVLVTGPTGAGKTTTLYAALNSIEDRDHTLNIVTIEDPVEHKLQFATQIQVNRDLGLDFPSILRTVLRQDPDVILVGEIRDAESAALALEAAMTGHLVLSSLHTYSALDTLVRLRDLQVKPYLLASALKGVISQQLLPRLCRGGTELVPSDATVVARLRTLGVLEADWSGALYREKNSAGLPPISNSGRVGAYEVMYVTDQLRNLIDREAPRNELEKALNHQYFFSFAKYCRFLLKEGLVSPERVEWILPKTPLAFSGNKLLDME
jgi:type II secretory ATPase GspE/PulE/Tfp pilus assembly ATPase PilB-like protein/CRP-like cAMP-binding protein